MLFYANFSRVIRGSGSVRNYRLAGLYPFTFVGIFYWIVYLCCSEAKQYKKIEWFSFQKNTTDLQAIRLVDRALIGYECTDEDKADLCVIKANSYLKLNENEKALGALNFITENYPKTESAYKASALLDSNEICRFTFFSNQMNRKSALCSDRQFAFDQFIEAIVLHCGNWCEIAVSDPLITIEFTNVIVNVTKRQVYDCSIKR